MKKNVSINDYIVAGAWLRLSKTVLATTIVFVSKILTQREIARLITAHRNLSEVSNIADIKVHNKYPEREGVKDIFYGAVDVESRSEIDSKVRRAILDAIDAIYSKALKPEIKEEQ